MYLVYKLDQMHWTRISYNNIYTYKYRRGIYYVESSSCWNNYSPIGITNTRAACLLASEMWPTVLL